MKKKLLVIVVFLLSIAISGYAESDKEKSDDLSRSLGLYVKLEDFLVRYAYRAADSYDIEISVGLISFEGPVNCCSFGNAIAFYDTDRKVTKAQVKISVDTTDEEMAAVFCMIDALEITEAEYTVFGANAAKQKVMEITRKAATDGKYRGTGYTFYIDNSEGYFCATLNSAKTGE